MRKRQYTESGAALVRIRIMFMGLIALLAVIALPLVIVWKQAYIASTSMRIEAMTDTISAMNRRIAGLEIACGRMSGNERIEAFARAALKLEYPASDRITIIPCDEEAKSPKSADDMAQLLAAVQDRRVLKEAGE
jgi:cell division protein FtsL